MSFRKNIWMYWDQGADKAPFLVKQCISSWQRLNPEWQLHVLDREQLLARVDVSFLLDKADFSLQWMSDIARLQLLAQHGGVWADATTFCVKPLDDWLEAHLINGFFAFSCQRNDRLLQSWFIAAHRHNDLLQAWLETTLEYAKNNQFRQTGYWARQYYRKLMSLRKRGKLTNDVWFNSFTRKLVKLRPYPAIMFLFERALATNPRLADKWAAHPALQADPCEHLQNNLGMNEAASDESRAFILSQSVPLHKLNWRQDNGCAIPESNLACLLSNNRNTVVSS